MANRASFTSFTSRYFLLNRGVLFIFVTLSVFLITACGGSGDGDDRVGKDLSKMNDRQTVEYAMKQMAPDSVARFICNAALGKIPGAHIDTLATATLYAYEYYKDEELQSFAAAYDEFAESLPLDEKMQLRKLAAQEDAMGMGYQLGLEYVNIIRQDHKNAAQVEKEIAALKRACEKTPEDSATYTRFMKGFKTALEYDGGDEIPREIYNKYAN